MNKNYSLAAVSLSVMLVACSSEPSSDDIKEALETSIQEAMQSTEKMMGGLIDNDTLDQFKTEVQEVEKLECKESTSASGFICDVKVKTSSQFTGENVSAASIRLIKGSDGWVVVE